MMPTETAHMFHSRLKSLVRWRHTPDHFEMLITLLFNNVSVKNIFIECDKITHEGSLKIFFQIKNCQYLSTTIEKSTYRNKPCSFSYSSSQQEKTSKHCVITRSKSSKGMCMSRRVPSTLRSCCPKSREMASTSLRPRCMGYLVERILRRCAKICCTANLQIN